MTLTVDLHVNDLKCLLSIENLNWNCLYISKLKFELFTPKQFQHFQENKR